MLACQSALSKVLMTTEYTKIIAVAHMTILISVNCVTVTLQGSVINDFMEAFYEIVS
jgi:hypothetical protein